MQLRAKTDQVPFVRRVDSDTPPPPRRSKPRKLSRLSGARNFSNLHSFGMLSELRSHLVFAVDDPAKYSDVYF